MIIIVFFKAGKVRGINKMFILKENSTGNILMSANDKYCCKYFAKYRYALQEQDSNKRKNIIKKSPEKVWAQTLKDIYTIYEVKHYNRNFINHYDVNKFVNEQGVEIM